MKIDLHRISKLAIQGTAGGLQNLAKRFATIVGQELNISPEEPEVRNDLRHQYTRYEFEGIPWSPSSINMDAPEHPYVYGAFVEVESGGIRQGERYFIPGSVLRGLYRDGSSGPTSNPKIPEKRLNWNDFSKRILIESSQSTNSSVLPMIGATNILEFEVNVEFSEESEAKNQQIWNSLVKKLLAELKPLARHEEFIIWVSDDFTSLYPRNEGDGSQASFIGAIFSRYQEGYDQEGYDQEDSDEN